MARNAELEAEIIAAPDEVAPYLVYADWLQRQGDPRGELIGVQLALETARGAEWAELKLREAELLPALTPEGPRLQFDWRRGFVDRMSGTYPVPRCKYYGGGDDSGALVHPSLALVRALSSIAFRNVNAVASPLMRELTAVYAPDAVLGHPQLRDLRLIGKLDALPAQLPIERLALGSNNQTPFDDLARCALPGLRLFQSLHVSEWRASETFEFALATGAELELELTERLPTAAVSALRLLAPRARGLVVRDPGWLRDLPWRLTWLDLRGLTAPLVAAIPSGVRHLSLQVVENSLAHALAAAPQLQSVESLTFLTHLDLGPPYIPESARARQGWLAAWARAFPRLDTLVIRDSTLAAVADSALAAQIQTLNLSDAFPLVVDQMLPHLRRFPRLHTLHIRSHSPLDAEQLVALGSLGIRVELAWSVPPVTGTRA